MADEDIQNPNDDYLMDDKIPNYLPVPEMQSDIHEASLFSQKELTKEEQQRAAIEMERKRQIQNNSENQYGSTPTNVSRVKQDSQTKNQIRQLSVALNSVRKKADEKAVNLQKSLRKATEKEREAEEKITGQVIRIVIEGVSLIGIPIMIWEVIKLIQRLNTVRSSRKKQKTIKRDLANIPNEVRSEERQIQANINYLINDLNIEAANEPMQGEFAA